MLLKKNTILKMLEGLNKIKRVIVNCIIGVIVLCGLESIIFSFPKEHHALAATIYRYEFFSLENISLHRALSVIIGFILIFLSYKLYKRMRFAWIIALSMLQILVILKVFKYHHVMNGMIILQLIAIGILILSYKDFNKVSHPIKLKWGITISSISIFLVLIYTAFAILTIKKHFYHIDDFGDAFLRALKLLFYMDSTAVEVKTKTAAAFAKTAIIINWASITSALILILNPLVYQPIVHRAEREKVRSYLRLYGDNSISYVALEKDKKYFFYEELQGVISYVIAAGVAVCAGDPICKKEDIQPLIRAFMRFCKDNDLSICFCQTSPSTISYFRDCGFGAAKYGEEAVFDLEQYELSGGKTAKLRQAINNANKLGIEVTEYKPSEKRDYKIEDEMQQVSREWLALKKSSELSFMLGSINLENPLDRRYFVAKDVSGKILAFIVFVPFRGGTGYYTDVTRRRRGAPIGTMEKIVLDAFMTMKSEGVKWGSLGLVPLAHAKEHNEGSKITGIILDFIYENMNNFYGFKTLHQYKRKYAPTLWETRYLVYYPGIFSPKIAYAVVKAQNPKGVTDYMLQQIKMIYSSKSSELSS